MFFGFLRNKLGIPIYLRIKFEITISYSSSFYFLFSSLKMCCIIFDSLMIFLIWWSFSTIYLIIIPLEIISSLISLFLPNIILPGIWPFDSQLLSRLESRIHDRHIGKVPLQGSIPIRTQTYTQTYPNSIRVQCSINNKINFII